VKGFIRTYTTYRTYSNQKSKIKNLKFKMP